MKNCNNERGKVNGESRRITISHFDRLGDILITMGYIDRETIESFLYKGQQKIINNSELQTSIEKLVAEDRQRYISKYKSYLLGKQLVDAKLITEEQLGKAISLKENLKSDLPNITRNKLILVAEILYKISRSNNIYSILKLIMEYCNKVICAEASTLFLYNKEKNTLHFDVVTGKKKDDLIMKEMPADWGVAGWVFKNNESTTVNDVKNDQRFCSFFDETSGFETKNILCVPLRVNVKSEGALEVINKIADGDFDKDDECLLQILADKVGIHLENRILIEHLQTKAEQLEKGKNKYKDLYSEKEKLLEKLSHTLEELKSNQKELENVNRELEDFVYIISHDLKEPLFSINSYTKRLSNVYKDIFDEKGNSYIDRIKANTEMMFRKLIEIMEVLEVSRVTYNFENNDIGVIVRDMVGVFKEKSRNNRIEIIIQENLPFAYCDQRRIKVVFSNLITNAIKFIGNDNHRQIRIGYDKEGDYHKFSVEDTGIGIQPEHHEQIFKIFTRLKDIETEGTGVGLVIASKIVNLHNGKIWVESPVKEARGARFCFTIPI